MPSDQVDLDDLERKLVQFNAPVSVAPLSGKYYGTVVVDADGEDVVEFWDHGNDIEPSSREKAKFGDDWTPEKWSEYCCDSHWESQRDYERAVSFAALRNAAPALIAELRAARAELARRDAAIEAAKDALREAAHLLAHASSGAGEYHEVAKRCQTALAKLEARP